MLPFFVAAWQTDATVHGAIEEQLQAGITGAGNGALLTGGEISADTNAIGASSTWGLRGAGRYAHALGFSFAGGTAPPTDNGSFNLAGVGSMQLGSQLQLGLDTTGTIATRFGLRAVDGAVAVDPFQTANRLTYSFGGGASLFAITGKRSSLRFSAGYTQEGGLAADVPDAVGLDAMTGRTAVGWGWELGGRDNLVPELRLAATHFEHAILDVDLRRGRVDTTAVTAIVSETHTFSRRVYGDVSGGATVTRSVIAAPDAGITGAVAPEVHVGLNWISRSARVGASYTLGYAALGARVAYGQQHGLMGELALRPVSGARWRDLLVHATARFAYGTAPVAIPAAAGGAAPPGRGWVTTTTMITGALVELPLARGVSLRGGIDLQLARGVVDPAPRGGSPGLELQTVVLFGIAGTLSTDPTRSAHKDPLEEEEAREHALPGAGERAEDRAREYRPRPGDSSDDEILDTDREAPGNGAPD